MFSFFKKKKEEVAVVENNVELKQENFMHANPQDFGWDLAEKNNLNTATIGSGEVSIESDAPDFSIDNFIEAPKKSITKNRVLKRDENQGSRVLSILKDNPKGLTRYEIKDHYVKLFGNILDTSLSRAISCLSYDTKIEMTDITKLERYGKVCHIYKAN
jgi:hypothetical protein